MGQDTEKLELNLNGCLPESGVIENDSGIWPTGENRG